MSQEVTSQEVTSQEVAQGTSGGGTNASEESLLDSIGPYVIWVGMTIVLAVTLAVVFVANDGIFDRFPVGTQPLPAVAEGPP